MTPEDQNETTPSRFRALAFRNPFASPSRNENYPTATTSGHCMPESTAVHAAEATSSGVASTIPSTAPSAISSLGNTAATSPTSEHCPDIEQHDHVTPSCQGLDIIFPPGKADQNFADGDEGNSIASSDISPFGSPHINRSLINLEDTGTAVDGGADSLQSNMSISKSSKMSPIRLSGSPLNISRPESLAGSFQSVRSEQSAKSFRSYGSSIGDGGEWEFDSLLEMTDEIRAALKTRGTIPKSSIEELSVLLDALLQIEASVPPSTEFDLLIHTRLDELLRDIGDSKETMSQNMDKSQVTIFIKAGSLRRKWERRFKGLYFNINKPRTEQMINGPLRGLGIIGSNGDQGLDWLVSHVQPADLEGHLNFTPGDWWLNMHCALRDGAVGSVDKMLTMGKSGVVALALLAGEEVTGPTLNLFEYTKIGHNMDELMKLMACNRGRPIRLLRGSNLKSKYAPSAGVRYDGLHLVKQFGHQLLDESQNVYRCTIMLERSTSQKPFAEVLRLPKPSHLDDWILYKRFVGEEYRKREGEAAFEKWIDLEEEKQADKEQFLKARALQEGIRRYTVVERKPNNLQTH
ncbi:hypothetical protein ONS95_013212 [Cadophora gregata]|uniref:uncharacterized protein n=1 Tax=Cadophora gregata TaxID=51156 RepID=UPI0026DBE569|nr:uncharacterized protein ONS95_013212 [Cadophora gregata]KAK0099966.1 hypothetical protein ONS96_007911 [Cadophora gregata f. sp. sojae]KAK0116182.1 hypothetical protein ONS95_013212 [Cadophora gregata]